MSNIRFFKKTENQTFEEWQEKFVRDANALAARISQLPVYVDPVATTSGSTWDFTGIPSWVKQFDVSFDGVSLSGTDNLLIQLGDSGGFETSGYLSTSASIQDAATPGVSSSTAGFIIRSGVAADSIQGFYSFSLLDSSTNTWTGHGGFYRSTSVRSVTAGGSKSLSSTLTQVRVTVTGANTGDAGKVGLIYR